MTRSPAGITTAVIMVVAAVSPQHAWQQPILRLANSVVGVAVGALAAWTVTRVKRLLSARSVPAAPAKVKIDLTERAAFNIRTSNGREGQWNRPPSASAPSTMRGGRCTTGACHSSARLGVPATLAEVYADRIDWHQFARLVQRGCPLRLALRITN